MTLQKNTYPEISLLDSEPSASEEPKTRDLNQFLMVEGILKGKYDFRMNTTSNRIEVREKCMEDWIEVNENNILLSPKNQHGLRPCSKNG